jgi:putative autoinducer-2 (AI-2) aldolase
LVNFIPPPGEKLPEPKALQLAYDAIQRRAVGVNMGGNIFQADRLKAMIQADRAIVYKNVTPPGGPFNLKQQKNS